MQKDNLYSEFEKDIREIEKLLAKQAEGLQDLKRKRIIRKRKFINGNLCCLQPY